MKCSDCNYCWQNPEDDYPRCHYEGLDGTAPCEYEDEERNDEE
jgi:hypothetical protein